jgi:hypothetical protein
MTPFQGSAVTGTSVAFSTKWAASEAGFLLALLFNPGDWGDMFLQNVG